MAKSEQETTLLRVAGPADFARTFRVPHETVEKLELYADILHTWQKAVNLVSPATLDDIWQRHFTDSAQLLNIVPTKKSWIDLGSGGGFPGLVIAILTANQENHSVQLIESNSRKCAFLSEVARRTHTPVIIHEGRIEDMAHGGKAGKADVVTSRALAPLDTLLGLARGFFTEETVGLFLKGREASHEIDEARRKWHFECECVPSRTSGEGRIVEVRNLS
jgi:16S rRNA (guanine527-N7)-methyltransferase